MQRIAFALVLCGATSALGPYSVDSSSALGDTILIFEDEAGTPLTSVDFPDYGDRVASTTQNGLNYGGAADTPHIVTDFESLAKGWSTNYGDLLNVVYPGQTDPVLQLTFTADPGYEVRLHSFDLGGWPATDYTIDSVQVLDGSDQVLFSELNVLVQGDAAGPLHTSIILGPLVANVLKIRIDASNITGGNPENVGLDNVRFSQIPEPSTGLSALVAALLLVFAKTVTRRRYRRG